MNAFRYQAIEGTGAAVNGVIEAEDRKTALQLLGQRGLFPSNLEVAAAGVAAAAAEPETKPSGTSQFRLGTGVNRKEITAFTQEMGALLGAAIPIPQALDGLAEGEENPALKTVVARIAESVRKGTALSAA